MSTNTLKLPAYLNSFLTPFFFHLKVPLFRYDRHSFWYSVCKYMNKLTTGWSPQLIVKDGTALSLSNQCGHGQSVSSSVIEQADSSFCIFCLICHLCALPSDTSQELGRTPQDLQSILAPVPLQLPLHMSWVLHLLCAAIRR